jgi:hypothetical protein
MEVLMRKRMETDWKAVWSEGTCRVALLIFAIFLLSGCVSHVKDLRDAQDQFNTAASLENQMKLDPRNIDASAVGSITASYRLSLTMISNLIDKNKGDLEKDNLLGVAYTLKALTEWRLGDYTSARTTAALGRQLSEASLFPRDRALLEALPGLIKNDQAYQHLVEGNYPYVDIKRLLTESLRDLDEGMKVGSAGENLRLFFLVSKLAVLKNWLDLTGDNKIKKPTDFKDEIEHEEWCRAAKPTWALFTSETQRAKKGQEAEEFSLWWGRVLGLPEACENP